MKSTELAAVSSQWWRRSDIDAGGIVEHGGLAARVGTAVRGSGPRQCAFARHLHGHHRRGSAMLDSVPDMDGFLDPIGKQVSRDREGVDHHQSVTVGIRCSDRRDVGRGSACGPVERKATDLSGIMGLCEVNYRLRRSVALACLRYSRIAASSSGKQRSLSG
jgi:hypothetical protein